MSIFKFFAVPLAIVESDGLDFVTSLNVMVKECGAVYSARSED
jgi:hypothetical protein